MHTVTAKEFACILRYAQSVNPKIAAATTKVDEFDFGDVSCYINSFINLSGFVVGNDGELTGLFSLAKGYGDRLVNGAIALGANHLDCFDGYLPTFYARHGFAEIDREPNWVAGGPDVVFMALSHHTDEG